jgi:Arc/MetJ-type ribon-helix-helix transcriptional regulator
MSSRQQGASGWLSKRYGRPSLYPLALLAAVDEAVQAGKAHSRNELVRIALERELAAQKRAAIDAAFAEMAEDPDYQVEAKAIADEFATADWEAWQQVERER